MLRAGRNEGGFIGDRLRLARTFRGLTQTELAGQVSLSAARISLFEHEKEVPQGIHVEALAEVTGFESAFFRIPVKESLLNEQSCSFRRLRSAPKREKDQLLAQGTLIVLLMRHLRGRLALPEYSVPTIKVTSVEEVEQAAEACRRCWGIDPAAPIVRVGRVLENAGVVWVIVDAGTPRVDAFSYPGDVSIVFANAAKHSTSRTVFDLAHELGHLVLHRDTGVGLQEREEQANRFASSFLLPRSGFAREFPRSGVVDWGELFALKRRWGASAAAIVRRAYDLELIGPSQYLRAYKYIHAKGWHRGEPEEPAPERPELIALALGSLEKELGEGPGDVARQLGWKPETLAEVTGLPIEFSQTKAALDIRDAYRRRRIADVN